MYKTAVYTLVNGVITVKNSKIKKRITANISCRVSNCIVLGNWQMYIRSTVELSAPTMTRESDDICTNPLTYRSSESNGSCHSPTYADGIRTIHEAIAVCLYSASCKAWTEAHNKRTMC